MARNKYPEVTVERILDVAQRLFLKKDMTTRQSKISLMNWMVCPKARSIIILNRKRRLWMR